MPGVSATGPLVVDTEDLSVVVTADAVRVAVAAGADTSYAVALGAQQDVAVTVQGPVAQGASAATEAVVVAQAAPVTLRLSDPAAQGTPGANAYQLAQAQGFTGTLQAWLASFAGRTLEFEYVARVDGEQLFTLPSIPSAVQGYYLNGLRERTSNFALSGAVVTAPPFVVTDDLVVVVYYP